MSGLLIAIGVAFAGWCIGTGLEDLGDDVKEGLEALANALREIDEP